MVATRKNALNIRDRIIDFRRVSAAELVPNPKNFRVHTDAQRQYFRSILDTIGFVGVELTRELSDGSLMLIDGHMRQEEVGDALIPVAVTDLSEAEADVILATFDALGRLAGTDQDKAASLIESLGMAGHDAAADLLNAVARNDQTAALLESLADGMLDRDGSDGSGGEWSGGNGGANGYSGSGGEAPQNGSDWIVPPSERMRGAAEMLDVYNNSTLRQIVLIMGLAQYAQVLTEFKAILQAQHLDTNIQVVLYLLDYYWAREGERPQSSTLDATADEDEGDTDGGESVHDLELAGLGAETV